jgi:hypothetical protein
MKKPSKEILVTFFSTEELPSTPEEIMKFVTHFMIKNHHCHDVHNINRGWCFIWAYLVWCLLSSEDDEISFVNLGDCGHVILKFKNKFYDSENQHGNSSCDDFRRFGLQREYVNLERMCTFWLRYGYEKHLFKKVLIRTQPHCKFSVIRGVIKT